jgi:hypothetical protein
MRVTVRVGHSAVSDPPSGNTDMVQSRRGALRKRGRIAFTAPLIAMVALLAHRHPSNEQGRSRRS